MPQQITIENACNSLIQGLDSPVSIIESCDLIPTKVSEEIYTFEMCTYEDSTPIPGASGRGPGGFRPGDRHRFRVVVFKLPVESIDD